MNVLYGQIMRGGGKSCPYGRATIGKDIVEIKKVQGTYLSKVKEKGETPFRCERKKGKKADACQMKLQQQRALGERAPRILISKDTNKKREKIREIKIYRKGKTETRGGKEVAVQGENDRGNFMERGRNLRVNF